MKWCYSNISSSFSLRLKTRERRKIIDLLALLHSPTENAMRVRGKWRCHNLSQGIWQLLLFGKSCFPVLVGFLSALWRWHRSHGFIFLFEKGKLWFFKIHYQLKIFCLKQEMNYLFKDIGYIFIFCRRGY